MGLNNCIADLFLDRDWAASRNQNIDISINEVYESEHPKLIDQRYGDCVLPANSNLFSMFDDAFTNCTDGINGISLFGLVSHDVGPELLPAKYIGGL